MSIRTLAITATATLFMGGVALAQDADVSGPAAGGNVNPSASVQKGRSSATDKSMGASAIGGGAGIQGPVGSKNGPAQTSDKAKSDINNQ